VQLINELCESVVWVLSDDVVDGLGDAVPDEVDLRELDQDVLDVGEQAQVVVDLYVEVLDFKKSNEKWVLLFLLFLW